MNNAVVVWANDHLIIGIVVQAFDVVIDVVRFRDVRAVLFSDQTPAELAPIAIQELEVLPDLAVQLSDPCHPLIQDEARLGIDKIVIEIRFDTALLLVFDHFPEILQIVRNDRLQYIAVIVLCSVNRKVFLQIIGKLNRLSGTDRLQAFDMFDIGPTSEKALP